MSVTSEVLLRKLTRREFRQGMAAGQWTACIVPVAAIEQHLEHLAMEHDWRSACHIATQVAGRLHPEALVAEALMIGISEHHMKHPGTLTLRTGTFLCVLEDVIDSLVRAGFQNILVLNGHGGNVAPCNAVWDQFLRRFQVNLHFLSYWDVLTDEDGSELLDSDNTGGPNLPGHAQEFETSFAMAGFPENVRIDMWTDQPDPTPSLGTAEKGLRFIERIVERVTIYLQEMVSGARTIEIPPFHP